VQKTTNIKLSISPCLYPDAARRYAILSPDIHCLNHLQEWLKVNGRSLDSYEKWLKFRIAGDVLSPKYTELDNSIDWLDEFDPQNQIDEQVIESLKLTFSL
jgi:hypothetical protein